MNLVALTASSSCRYLLSTFMLAMLVSCARSQPEVIEEVIVDDVVVSEATVTTTVQSNTKLTQNSNDDGFLLSQVNAEVELTEDLSDESSLIRVLNPSTLVPLQGSDLPEYLPTRNELDQGRLSPGQPLINRGVEPTLYFAYDQYALLEATSNALMGHIALLKQQPQLRILFEGHTDERGTSPYNIALAFARANAAADFLRQQGIDSNRIDVSSFGEERPALIGEDEIYWRYNRRVEIYYR